MIWSNFLPVDHVPRTIPVIYREAGSTDRVPRSTLAVYRENGLKDSRDLAGHSQEDTLYLEGHMNAQNNCFLPKKSRSKMGIPPGSHPIGKHVTTSPGNWKL